MRRTWNACGVRRRHAPTSFHLKRKALHEKHCTACHVKMFGGDGNMVYTRSPRLISNPTALKQRVAACSAQTGAKLFPDEEEKIAAYLTQQFYKFK